MAAAGFQTPEAYAQFRKQLAKLQKGSDPKVYAQFVEVLAAGRDLVGWRDTGREMIGTGARRG